jgi:hypothetical protein
MCAKMKSENSAHPKSLHFVSNRGRRCWCESPAFCSQEPRFIISPLPSARFAFLSLRALQRFIDYFFLLLFSFLRPSASYEYFMKLAREKRGRKCEKFSLHLPRLIYFLSSARRVYFIPLFSVLLSLSPCFFFLLNANSFFHLRPRAFSHRSEGE